jgi:RNA polymerase sigma-54 factor
MKLDFNLQISQKQGLALTAQVQQAIKLLQMTNMEICEFVEEQFQDNPFVEETSFTEKNKLDDPTNKTSKELDKSLEENPYKNSTEQSKVSQENQFETGEAYTPRSTVAKEASDFDAINLVAAGKKSLYAHCLEFCDSLQLSTSENLVAQKLIEELEPTGWISTELKAIAEDLNVEDTLVSEVLLKLQDIEPAGLFARTLKECLTLQAIDREIYCDTMQAILDNLHLIGSGKFDLLKRRSGCSDAEIAKFFQKIKSLDPKPGLQFDASSAPIREPDLRVKETQDGWAVELNNSTLPDVKISKDFAKELTKKVNEKAEREFIREKITEAKWLQNAINKRNETMLKVGSEIIKRQTEFLEKGAQYIQPMILNDIAEAVGMHESTISRVTTGSLIQTPRGTLELKAFFSVGIKQGADADTTSAASVRYRIKKLIEQENPNAPISDDAIVDTLLKDGVKVARRTVAKYRKIEHIPSSFARKRRNVLAGSAH